MRTEVSISDMDYVMFSFYHDRYSTLPVSLKLITYTLIRNDDERLGCVYIDICFIFLRCIDTI